MVRSALLVAALATLALAAPPKNAAAGHGKPKLSKEQVEWLTMESRRMTQSPKATPLRSDCTYTLDLTDTWGDGWYNWNGDFHHLEVTLDGANPFADDSTLVTVMWDGEEADSFEASFEFPVTGGEELQITFVNTGNWAGECSYVVLDAEGTVVADAPGGGGASGDPGPPPTTLTTQCGPTECDFTLVLQDAWGDGWYNWNGDFHSLEVTLDGVDVFADDSTLVTIVWDGEEADSFEAAFTFPVTEGAELQITFINTGNWAGECSYVLLDNAGTVLAEAPGGGGASGDPGPPTTNLTVECAAAGPAPPPPTPAPPTPAPPTPAPATPAPPAPPPPAGEGCDFTLELSDTWGDGWYNWNQEFHYLDVTLDGAAVLPEDTVITIAWDGEEADTFFASFEFPVYNGGLLEVEFVSMGAWSGECSYTILDNLGDVLASAPGGGGGQSDPGPPPTTLTVECGVLTECQLSLGDLDGDGSFTVSDVALLVSLILAE